MKRIIKASILTAALSFGPVAFGQTVVEPTYNAAQLAAIQDVTDGNDVTSSVREMTATVGNGETWIPLGYFSYGSLHELRIDTGGHSGNSSAITEFSIAFGGRHFTVHRLQKFNIQNRFKLYSSKYSRGRLIFLKYINEAGEGRSNIVKIKYTSTVSSKWEAWSQRSDLSTFDFNTITDADEFKPVFETQSGGLYDGFKKGVFVYGQPVMTRASGAGSSSSSSGFAGGYSAIASGNNSISYGQRTKAYGLGSAAFGFQTTAGLDTLEASENRYATAFGRETHASGTGSLAVGYKSKALGATSFAGGHATAAGTDSFAYGDVGVLADGHSSVALGANAKAYNRGSMSFGENTVAGDSNGGRNDNIHAVAMGIESQATAKESVAIGYNNKATAQSAVAMGRETLAEGIFSHSNGVKTIARDRAQFVVGQYNKPVGTPGRKLPHQASALFIVGNGANGALSNALEVHQDGTTKVKGNLEVSGAIAIEPQGDISMGIFE